MKHMTKISAALLASALIIAPAAAQDKKTTDKTSNVRQQEMIDCYMSWDVVEDFFKKDRGASNFSDLTAEEATENKVFWMFFVEYVHKKKKARKRALKNNYVNDIEDLGKQTVWSFTEGMISDCKGHRSNLEELQGKTVTYPNAMTAAEQLEIRKAERAKNGTSISNRDMVKHANTMVCNAHFTQAVSGYKGGTQGNAVAIHDANKVEKVYWDEELKSVPDDAAQDVRIELAGKLKEAKSGNAGPFTILMCLSEHEKRVARAE